MLGALRKCFSNISFCYKHFNIQKFNKKLSNEASSMSPFSNLLDPLQQQAIQKEKSVLQKLSSFFQSIKVTNEDQQLLNASIRKLDELFLLTVCGEFNSGKSSLLNSLLGSRWLKEGVTPTTSSIHIIKYGPFGKSHPDPYNPAVQVEYFPVEWLKNINVVDTPGTNAVIQGHQELTHRFIPESDLVLFVTSYDRPFSLSEKNFLEIIQKWKRKVVFCLTKIDQADSDGDLDKVMQFLKLKLKEILLEEPIIFQVSSKWKIQALKNNDQQLLEKSQIPSLEDYVLKTLDPQSRLQLKLLSPLGVAQQFIVKYGQQLKLQLATVATDRATAAELHAQIAQYQRDMTGDFNDHLARVDSTLLKLQNRADNFIEERFQISNALELIQPTAVKNSFLQFVIADTDAEIERNLQYLTDWITERNERQWRSITSILSSKESTHPPSKSPTDFDSNRKKLMDSIKESANRVISSFDKQQESSHISDIVRTGVYQTFAAEATALGIFSIAFLDISGILAAGALAIGGFYILPLKRRQIRKNISERIKLVRERLNDLIQSQFEVELNSSANRFKDLIQPFTHYVDQQDQLIKSQIQQINNIDEELNIIRNEVTSSWSK